MRDIIKLCSVKKSDIFKYSLIKAAVVSRKPLFYYAPIYIYLQQQYTGGEGGITYSISSTTIQQV